jgi:hypothetical protein
MSKNVFFKNIEKNILRAFFPVVFYITLMKISFAAMINMRTFNTDTASESAGSFASVLYIIFVGVIFFFFLSMALYYWYDIRQQTQRFGNLASEDDIRKNNFKGSYLFYEYRTENFYHYLYPCYFIIRRILVASLFVFWQEDGFFQVCFLSLLSAVSLVWHVSYSPFRSRIRNVFHAIHEVGYLTVMMIIFPYVYPEMNKEKYDFYPIILIIAYAVIYVAAMLFGLLGMLGQLYQKEDEIPIIQEPDHDYPINNNQDVLEGWLEGKETHKPKMPPEEEKVPVEVSPDITEKKPPQKSKTGQSIESDEEPEESEETESLESEETESEESKEGDEDLYANTRNIPQAEVNLEERGFSTGMSALREKQIQDYRNMEKSGKF